MEFRFQDIAAGKGHTQIDATLRADDIARGRNDVVISEPVHVGLSVKADSEGLARVYGKLTAKMELQCSRCLTSFTENCVILFDEQFKLKDSTDLPAEDEADDVIVVADDLVDLKPYVEETLLMNLPYVPLCVEACKGLCPTCGTNRNEHPCGCLNERIDPRLAGLQDFFKK